MEIGFDNTFNKELPADPERENFPRQVKEACFSYVTPRIPKKPTVLHVSDEMAMTLGFTKEDIASAEFQQVFTGAKVPKGAEPYAMCYGGHQFGHWAGQVEQ